LKIANIKLKDQREIINKVNDILRQQKDELQIQANKLTKLNADKDRFMAILGHDLKSPFNILLGLSDMLAENIRVFPVSEIEDIAVNLNKTARNTYNLLEDILLWTRAQSGKITFKPQKLKFSDICKDILEIFNPVASSKGIRINYSEADEIYLFGDLDMIKTIMRNLVSNAVKFTKNDGTINISTRETESRVTISVADDGIGISQDNLLKLFKNTEVITTTGTANEKGTGLGLLLCKEFVEKHNGKIWVESEPGNGSKFSFTLPLKTDQ
jgi:signal transduction histidine kinase